MGRNSVWKESTSFDPATSSFHQSNPMFALVPRKAAQTSKAPASEGLGSGSERLSFAYLPNAAPSFGAAEAWDY